MKEFFSRLKKTLLFTGLIMSLWGLGLLLMNGIWWLQDNWAMPDSMRNIIMWILIIICIGFMIYALWNLLKIVYIGFHWLFIEPFRKSHGSSE